MQMLAAIAGALMVLGTLPQTGVVPTDDEVAIRRVLAEFERIWDEPGMPGFENLFTEDADSVVITGRWLKGRTEIAAYHRELLNSVYKGSKSLPETTGAGAMRFLRPDIAIVHREGGATFDLDGKQVTRTGARNRRPRQAGRRLAYHRLSQHPDARLQASGAEVMQEPIDQPYGIRDCAFHPCRPRHRPLHPHRQAPRGLRRHLTLFSRPF